MHTQAERAALIAATAFEYKLKLDAGEVKPLFLNEQELTTAYHEWIFNATRKPCLGSDEMEKFPGNDYCVTMWKGHAFRMTLFVKDCPVRFEELYIQFQFLLSQQLQTSWVGILTSDNRQTWAEVRS